MCYNRKRESYENKPRKYKHQATVETVNAGQPYYLASPTYGYDGLHLPVAGSISELPDCNHKTGVIELRRSTFPSLWVTTTASRHQFGDKFHRCSLSDDGVVYQTYNDRLAFLNEEAARHYAETGEVKGVQMTKSDLKTGMVVEIRRGKTALVLLDTQNGDVVSGPNLWGSLKDYNKNFENKYGDKEYDIVKVYQPQNNNSYYSFEDLTLIWERDESTEMTMEEVCKALGKQIKIVK